MNAGLSYSERVEKAAHSLHHAKTLLSAADIRMLAQQALVANSILEAIKQACETACDHNTAIKPEGLLEFISDNLNSQFPPEAPHAETQAQVQGA